jgi:hypothetical protein
MLIFNPEAQAMPFTLSAGGWRLLLDSSGDLAAQLIPQGQPLSVPARALLVLRCG